MSDKPEIAEYTDTAFIRQLIDQYQGTCFPLNRTSIRALLDSLEKSRAENERLRALVQEHITVHHCLVCGSADCV